LRLKIFKKLRTASLNSEFTGSYKKVKSMTFSLLGTGFKFIGKTEFVGKTGSVSGSGFSLYGIV